MDDTDRAVAVSIAARAQYHWVVTGDRSAERASPRNCRFLGHLVQTATLPGPWEAWREEHAEDLLADRKVTRELGWQARVAAKLDGPPGCSLNRVGTVKLVGQKC